MTSTTPTETDSPPPVEQLEARREDLGVAKCHLGCVIGYSTSTSFNHAILNGRVPPEKRRRMVVALDHVEREGYLPLPEEVADD